MKRIPTLIVKWLANKLGYKIAMLKASKGTTTIEGDKELLRYVDITGYFFKKESIKLIVKPQSELIEILKNQVADLVMMSKIELGDDVILEINRLQKLIRDINKNK